MDLLSGSSCMATQQSGFDVMITLDEAKLRDELEVEILGRRRRLTRGLTDQTTRSQSFGYFSGY